MKKTFISKNIETAIKILKYSGKITLPKSRQKILIRMKKKNMLPKINQWKQKEKPEIHITKNKVNTNIKYTKTKYITKI